MDTLPAAALGHFVMKVANLGASYRFFADLGLRQIGLFPDVAIIELRGGTHILLFPENNDDAPFRLTSGRLGQRGAFFNEHLDLLINGKTRGELEAYRAKLLKNGVAAGEIAQEQFFGHDYFQLTDPDGHGITVYTTHAGEAPV
jgi:catechol 2,3-dioxygenase-like lactoylglutathione lyase family enzyme